MVDETTSTTIHGEIVDVIISDEVAETLLSEDDVTDAMRRTVRGTTEASGSATVWVGSDATAMLEYRPVPIFKVGDRIEVIESSHEYENLAGRRGTIISLDVAGTGLLGVRMDEPLESIFTVPNYEYGCEPGHFWAAYKHEIKLSNSRIKKIKPTKDDLKIIEDCMVSYLDKHNLNKKEFEFITNHISKKVKGR